MLCRAGARSGQGEAGVETAPVEGSSRGGWKGGVESPPQKGPPLPLFGGQKERLGMEMRGSL